MKICKALVVSERRACTVLGQARKTQRHIPSTTDEETRLVARTIELATRYGRYPSMEGSKDNRYVKAGRVVSQSQEGGKNLEDGRVESTAEAAKEESPMA